MTPSRRVPQWLPRVTSAALALVLGVGLLTVLTGEQRPMPVAEAVEQVVTTPSPRPTPSASPSVAVPVAPTPEPEVEPEPVEVDEVRAALGPPPGPQVDQRPERTAPPGARYALLVGISDYRAPTADTIGSAGDVRLMASMLADAGWQSENVRVLVDGQASGAAIREGLAWLARKGSPGTFSLFHYSGHVKQHGGGRESLWPRDRDFVGDDEVTAALTQVRGRLWVDIAGCHAGSFEPGLPSDRVLFTGSSAASEKSYEYPDWGLSVWTGLLFDVGTAQGQADADGDGRVTMGEALRYATYYAQVITFYQRPYGRQVPVVVGDPVLGWTLADPPA